MHINYIINTQLLLLLNYIINTQIYNILLEISYVKTTIQVHIFIYLDIWNDHSHYTTHV